MHACMRLRDTKAKPHRDKQVTLDLGPTSMSAEEVEKAVAELEANWTADDYHVFDKNCVHFSTVLADKVSENGLPKPLIQVCGVSGSSSLFWMEWGSPPTVWWLSPHPGCTHTSSRRG